MNVLFDHVAVAVPRIADTTPFLVGELGGVVGFGAPSREFTFWHWDYPGGGRIEVIEPMGDGGFVHRHLDRQGAGIHHVTFKVSSLREVCDRAEALGYGIVGFDDSDPGWQEAFLHPKQAMGIVVQLVQERERSGGIEWTSPDPPPEPADRPPGVTIVGVRMRAADRDRALRQWSELLAGKVHEAPGELCFTWPDSGMRIAVTIDPSTDDRAEAIEIASDRPVTLPKGPVPAIGAEFRAVRIG